MWRNNNMPLCLFSSKCIDCALRIKAPGCNQIDIDLMSTHLIASFVMTFPNIDYNKRNYNKLTDYQPFKTSDEIQHLRMLRI